MLSGYKTYITAAVAILTAIGTYLSGDMSAAEAMQTGFGAIMAATLRNGIK